MPTGLEVPFRYPEFVATYKLQHVPEEVEDWLGCVVVNPVEQIISRCKEAVAALETISPCLGLPWEDNARGFSSKQISSVHSVLECVYLEASPAAIRSTIASKTLQPQLLETICGYQAAVEEGSSTPHRRWAAAVLESLPSDNAQDLLAASSSAPITLPADSVRRVLDVPSSTAKDEAEILRMASLLAAGACASRQADAAISLLTAAFDFAWDDNARGSLSASLSSAFNSAGNFMEAMTEAKEAVLLCKSPRGYANWAVAAAYLDDYEEAGRVLEEGLALYPTDEPLLRAQKSISRALCGRVVPGPSQRGKRYHRREQAASKVSSMEGLLYSNEFDYVTFNQRLVPAKMNPTALDGTVFRRVGDIKTLPRTSTAAIEPH